MKHWRQKTVNSAILNNGLSKSQLLMIKAILAQHSSAIEKVALFGSRANGKYKSHSDIDLVLYGDIDEKIADRLWTCFHESLLPYKVDISVYRHITYEPLLRHIDRNNNTLFTKEQLYDK